MHTLSFSAGGEDREVSYGGFETLAPGSYGKVEVKRGATVELSSGTYDFVEFDTDDFSRVRVDLLKGEVIVKVVKELEIDKGAEIKILNGTTHDLTLNSDVKPPLLVVDPERFYRSGEKQNRLFLWVVRIHRCLSKSKQGKGKHFCSRGYCVSTVGLGEETIRKYIREQEEAERQQLDLDFE